MRRRDLIATAPAIAGAIAGCSTPFSDDGGGRGPAETVRAYFEAIIEGRIEEANELLHPESPMDRPTQLAAERARSLELRIESTSVVSREGDTAVVGVVFSIVQGGDRQSTPEVQCELRKANCQWRMYDLGSDRGGGPEPPSVVWGSYERSEDGQITAVAFIHEGGDTVYTGTLYGVARSESVGPAPGATAVTVGDAIVVRLTAAGESFTAGTRIGLEWRPQDGTTEIVVAEHTLTGSTVGGLGPGLGVE